MTTEDPYDPHRLHLLPEVFPSPCQFPLVDADFRKILLFASSLEPAPRETIRTLVAECRRLIVKEKLAMREFQDEYEENLRLKGLTRGTAGLSIGIGGIGVDLHEGEPGEESLHCPADGHG